MLKPCPIPTNRLYVSVQVFFYAAQQPKVKHGTVKLHPKSPRSRKRACQSRKLRGFDDLLRARNGHPKMHQPHKSYRLHLGLHSHPWTGLSKLTKQRASCAVRHWNQPVCHLHLGHWCDECMEWGRRTRPLTMKNLRGFQPPSFHALGSPGWALSAPDSPRRWSTDEFFFFFRKEISRYPRKSVEEQLSCIIHNYYITHMSFNILYKYNI